MAQIGFSGAALEDFERIVVFYAEHDAELAVAQVRSIQQAIAVLEDHPLIGRPVRRALRELVISQGKTGFIALYAYYPQRGLVWVLRIRHQRELGYGE